MHSSSIPAEVSSSSNLSDKLIGTIDAVRNDTLVLVASDPSVPWTLPFRSIAKLEVSAGEGSASGIGAAIGCLSGLVIGGAVGYAVGNESCGSGGGLGSIDFCVEKPASAVLLALGGGLVGAGIGALVGSYIKTERWAYVQLENIRVGPAPQTVSGLALWMSLSF